MKCGILFSGGKDSAYAAYLAKKLGYDLRCLITIISENPDSYMFHTPSILKVTKQAEVMNIPLIIQKTKGIKEEELKDLEKIIQKSKNEFDIDTIVTGAVESVYQASRIQRICEKLEIKCFNPLWKIDQFELLHNLIDNNFEIIIIGVFAYPLDKTWLGKKIDEKFIEGINSLYDKYKINPAGEGGEIETFVLNCPLFTRRLKIIDKKIVGKRNSWRMEIEIN